VDKPQHREQPESSATGGGVVRDAAGAAAVGTMVLATLLGSPATPVGTAAAAERAELVDFNGDNLDDLAIGAPGENLGVRADAGAVNVQYGSPAGLAGNGQVLTQGTPEAGDRFGAALAKGRFNDDDFVDLAVDAPAEDLGRTDAGLVSLLQGSPAGLQGADTVYFQGADLGGGAGVGGVAEAGDLLGAAVE
jgi:hypothetical protein